MQRSYGGVSRTGMVCMPGVCFRSSSLGTAIAERSVNFMYRSCFGEKNHIPGTSKCRIYRVVGEAVQCVIKYDGSDCLSLVATQMGSSAFTVRIADHKAIIETLFQ